MVGRSGQRHDVGLVIDAVFPFAGDRKFSRRAFLTTNAGFTLRTPVAVAPVLAIKPRRTIEAPLSVGPTIALRPWVTLLTSRTISARRATFALLASLAGGAVDTIPTVQAAFTWRALTAFCSISTVPTHLAWRTALPWRPICAVPAVYAVTAWRPAFARRPIASRNAGLPCVAASARRALFPSGAVQPISTIGSVGPWLALLPAVTVSQRRKPLVDTT
ncbi:hypothetical protein [Enterovirga rhinocerotis]|uniref:Uncharacterized protein n=1 Tax=Enterovirga rhinocerotis TaxID=1339210 RepID=A0A4V3DXW9_9HYPH|nr:hypothetical protein [Enterovirga rhinocerotis]TDR90299.1 hypothetical protein EV668_3145 [Enterovirga rhinocerotis]